MIEVAGDLAAFAPRLREIVAAVDPEATAGEAISLEKAFEINGRLFQWMFMMEVALAGVASRPRAFRLGRGCVEEPQAVSNLVGLSFDS